MTWSRWPDLANDATPDVPRRRFPSTETWACHATARPESDRRGSASGRLVGRVTPIGERAVNQPAKLRLDGPATAVRPR